MPFPALSEVPTFPEVSGQTSGLWRGISGALGRTSLRFPVAILGVDSLSVAERVLLFCVASDTDPIKAGVSSATQVMILKNCLERDQDGHLAITDFGSRVLKSLIKLNAEGDGAKRHP
jgi:hypothetical protein